MFKFSEIIENEEKEATYYHPKELKSFRMSRAENLTLTFNSDNNSSQSDEYIHEDLKVIIDNKVKEIAGRSGIPIIKLFTLVIISLYLSILV